MADPTFGPPSGGNARAYDLYESGWCGPCAHDRHGIDCHEVEHGDTCACTDPECLASRRGPGSRSRLFGDWAEAWTNNASPAPRATIEQPCDTCNGYWAMSEGDPGYVEGTHLDHYAEELSHDVSDGVTPDDWDALARLVINDRCPGAAGRPHDG